MLYLISYDIPDDRRRTKLAKALKDWSGGPLFIIFAMMHSKDPAGFLKPLAGAAQAIFAIPIPGEDGSYSAEESARLSQEGGIMVSPAESLEHALSLIAAQGGPAGRILICGSLYLAGSVLSREKEIT